MFSHLLLLNNDQKHCKNLIPKIALLPDLARSSIVLFWGIGVGFM